MKSDRIYLEKIDVVRAIACLMVFLHHSVTLDYLQRYAPVYQGDFMDFDAMPITGILLNFSPFAFGYTAVQLFLLISGFLIHFGYLQRGASLDLPDYVNRRFWRIYPVYALVVVFFAFTVSTPVTTWDVLSHLLMVHNVKSTTIYTINPALWSLALEFQLYMLFPVFLYIRRKTGVGRAVLLLALLTLLFTVFIGIGSYAKGLSPMRMWVIWGMGAWLAERYWSGAPLPRLGKWPLLALLLLVVFCGRYFEFYSYYDFYIYAGFYLVALGSYLSRPEQKLNFLTRPVYRIAVWFGLISYSVYLIHQPFLGVLFQYLGNPAMYGFTSPSAVGAAVARAGAILLSLALLSGISYLLYLFVELPSIKWGKAFYGRFIKPYRGQPNPETEFSKT